MEGDAIGLLRFFNRLRSSRFVRRIGATGVFAGRFCFRVNANGIARPTPPIAISRKAVCGSVATTHARRLTVRRLTIQSLTD